ncbi:MAG TPA: hypothetical protein EYF98_08625 [Planctomycetes bacterium]|nr:hypothetical protein [Planctomycetota bacterium]
MTNVDNSKPRSTISLLHLMLVLSTISILSCAAILRWFGRADITLDSAVSLLAEDLRHVQARALLENAELQVVFFEDGGGYEVLNAKGQPIPGPIGTPSYLRRYDADAVFAGVMIGALDLGGARRIRYTPSGATPSQGTITVAFGDDVRSLALSGDPAPTALAPQD